MDRQRALERPEWRTRPGPAAPSLAPRRPRPRDSADSPDGGSTALDFIHRSDGSKLSLGRVRALLSCVSAAQVIQEIQHLTPTEQAEVIQFAYRLDAERMLSGKELVALAKKMVAAIDPTEALEIREQMIRGFYGGKADA